MLSKVLSLHRSLESELTKIIALLRDFRLEHARTTTVLVPTSPILSPHKGGELWPVASGNRSPVMRSFAGPHLAVRRRPQVIFYDLETTGLGATDKIGIREVGAAAFSSNGTFRRPVTPSMDITAGALAVAPLAADAAGAKPWAVVGPKFYAWVACQFAAAEPMPLIYLAGYNSKRYDSRILMFENHRHDVSMTTALTRSLRFVDMLEVIRALEPDIDKPRTLERVHQNLVGNAITSAHTALGDTYALKDISIVLEERHGDMFWRELKDRAESFDGVMKRCKLN